MPHGRVGSAIDIRFSSQCALTSSGWHETQPADRLASATCSPDAITSSVSAGLHSQPGDPADDSSELHADPGELPPTPPPSPSPTPPPTPTPPPPPQYSSCAPSMAAF